jgi:hypothetical protein
LKLPHLGEQTQILIAGETIGAETDVEVERVQSIELKWRMRKTRVTARAMDDLKV